MTDQDTAALVKRLRAPWTPTEGKREILCNLAAAALERPAPPELAGWRDIETAPKMEFDVVLLGRAGKNHTLPCFWNGQHWMVATVFGSSQIYVDPTHWMPLPPAPTPAPKGDPS